MISHDDKCIFIHIPKSAGTSLISALSNPVNPGARDINHLPFDPDAYMFDPPPPHLRIEDYVKYGYITKEKLDSYFKFAFVRNPWDRMVSEYKYRRHPSKYDFKTYLFKHYPRPSWTDEYCHVIPQYDFIYDRNNNCLIDFVGKFENLQQDFEKLCLQLQLPSAVLPHKNKSLSLFRRDNSLYDMLKTTKDFFSINQRRNTFSKYTQYYDD